MSGTGGFPLTGVGYVAQLESEYMLSQKLAICNNCFALGFDKPLKRCNGCHLAAYCSKECQRQHWPQHKKFCNLAQGKGKKNAYLSSLEQEECFRMVIDSYRLRVETDHLHRQEDHGIYFPGKWVDGLVWANDDVYADYQRFLDLAESSGILPVWWSFESRMECLAIAVDGSNEENVFNKIDQEQLLTKYGGDTTVRNALCILAELVVGYEGKGPAMDDTWFHQFQEFLDLHPEERTRLIAGTVEAVKAVLDAQGHNAATGDDSIDPASVDDSTVAKS